MPKLTDEELTTIVAYDSTAAEWTAKHDFPDFWPEELAEFRTLLPKGKVIEIGAGGNGRDARHLIVAGYEYLGIDISKGMLAEAAKRNPGVHYEHKSIYELNYPAESFDGFWMSNVLVHVPRDRVPEALASLHPIIRNGGIGFLSVKEGEGDTWWQMKDRRKKHHTSNANWYYTLFERNELRGLLENNGFHVLKTHRYPPGTHTVLNLTTIWLTALVQKI